jgi:6-pyruvoyl-tetrahydropterin synthase related domain
MHSIPRQTQSSPDENANLHVATPATGLNPPSLFPGPMAVVMAVAFVTIAPFLVWGNPSGHDFEFHMNSWMEVVAQWKQGVLYPHWASLAHWGYGEARFLFYPPTSWHLGALLALFMPWPAVPGAYIWLALSAAGCSMFLLARRWLPRTDAIFAAALYAANPYHLIVVYWRSALAELLASCLLPLLLLCVLDLADGRRRSIVPLSVVIAAAWLTNGPSAVMMNYSVALLAVVVATLRRQPRVLLLAGTSVVLGAMLASFYLFPAAHEQTWVNLSQVFAPGVRPQDNFLFTILKDADHNRFNWIVSILAVAEMIVLTGALGLTRRVRRCQPMLWWALAAWSVAAAVLMFPITALAWDYFPKLRFVQLPWRWLLCLNVAFALAVIAAFRRWWQRIAIYATILLVLGLLWHRVQPPWWDTAADINEMHDAILDGTGYEGTDEYVPAGVDPYEANKDAPEVALEGGGSTAHAVVHEWEAQSKEFTVFADKPLSTRLRLFNYPAWAVKVDGASVASETVESSGEILIPLATGTHQVTVTFRHTWDRTIGALISLLAVLVALALIRKSASDQPLNRV